MPIDFELIAKSSNLQQKIASTTKFNDLKVGLRPCPFYSQDLKSCTNVESYQLGRKPKLAGTVDVYHGYAMTRCGLIYRKVESEE